MYIFEAIIEEARAILLATGMLSAEHMQLMEPASNIKADLCFASFIAAKSAKTNPNVFVESLAKKLQLKPDGLIADATVSGAYLNFHLSPVVLAKRVVAEILSQPNYGEHNIGEGQTVLIDFSSPNVARKMHIGHLRSTIIGNALRNLLQAVGYKTIADNHLGDWGTQFGSLLAALSLGMWPKKTGNGLTTVEKEGELEAIGSGASSRLAQDFDAGIANEKEDPIEVLVRIYARFHRELKREEEEIAHIQQLFQSSAVSLQSGKDPHLDALKKAISYLEAHTPTLRDQARAHFLRLEQGDPSSRATWKWLIEITLQEFQKTYQRLGISFDIFQGESFYEPMLAGVIQEALDKKVAKIEASGAVSVHFEEPKLEKSGAPLKDEAGQPVMSQKYPSFLLRRSDGATLYQTRDVATCLYRAKTYKPKKNVYVVGGEQRLHFQQVFETVRRMGHHEIADASVHISFGRVFNKDGTPFSMRSGNTIFLEDVLDEAVRRAKLVVQEKVSQGKTELTADEIEKVSEAVGIGALLYYDLHQDTARNIYFDWDEMLALQGNSAPYLQFMYARCASILRKAEPGKDADYSLLSTPQEQALIKQLTHFPKMVLLAAQKMSPSQVAISLYSIACAFSDFYNACSVLEADAALRDARLGLVAATAQCIKKGLSLLGIQSLEKM